MADKENQMTDQRRVAKDPEDYVRRLNRTFAEYGHRQVAKVVSIDGETKSGLKRYTLRIENKR